MFDKSLPHLNKKHLIILFISILVFGYVFYPTLINSSHMSDGSKGTCEIEEINTSVSFLQTYYSEDNSSVKVTVEEIDEDSIIKIYRDGELIKQYDETAVLETESEVGERYRVVESHKNFRDITHYDINITAS